MAARCQLCGEALSFEEMSFNGGFCDGCADEDGHAPTGEDDPHYSEYLADLIAQEAQ